MYRVEDLSNTRVFLRSRESLEAAQKSGIIGVPEVMLLWE